MTQPKTLDLLDRAEARAKSVRALSRELGLPSNALGNARHKGHLSPAVAATLAQHIGETPTQAARWCLLAVAENEKSLKLRPKLKSIVEGLKSYFRAPAQEDCGTNRKP